MPPAHLGVQVVEPQRHVQRHLAPQALPGQGLRAAAQCSVKISAPHELHGNGHELCAGFRQVRGRSRVCWARVLRGLRGVVNRSLPGMSCMAMAITSDFAKRWGKEGGAACFGCMLGGQVRGGGSSKGRRGRVQSAGLLPLHHSAAGTLCRKEEAALTTHLGLGRRHRSARCCGAAAPPGWSPPAGRPPGLCCWGWGPTQTGSRGSTWCAAGCSGGSCFVQALAPQPATTAPSLHP